MNNTVLLTSFDIRTVHIFEYQCGMKYFLFDEDNTLYTMILNKLVQHYQYNAIILD